MHSRDRIPYFVVFVSDHNRAGKFFTERLGMKVGSFPSSGVDSRMEGHSTALTLHCTTLLLVNTSAPDNISGVEAGHGYPSFEVANLDTFHANALKHHVECLQPPTDDELGRTAVYKGPDDLIVFAVQPKKKPESHGIVLSGGGAYGAFELGVLRRLAVSDSCGHGGLNEMSPSVVTGTSVGAFNAAWLACALGGTERPLASMVEELTAIWRNRIAGGLADNGAFRIRGNLFALPSVNQMVQDAAFLAQDVFNRFRYIGGPPPEIARFMEMLDISSLVSPEPLRKLIEDTLSWKSLKNSPCRLQVAVTDWVAGSARLFTHGCTELRDEERMVEDNFFDAVMASTAIPGFFPPVQVESSRPGGHREKRTYVDGGLVMNSPLNPAIDAGATHIHLICLNPDVSTLSLSPVNSTIDTLQRSLATSVAAGVASELSRVKLGNRLAGVVRRHNSDEFYREVTVHRYHPLKEVLGGVRGILDFSLEHLDALIANGEQVAASHDCERENCILPKNHGGYHGHRN